MHNDKKYNFNFIIMQLIEYKINSKLLNIIDNINFCLFLIFKV